MSSLPTSALAWLCCSALAAQVPPGWFLGTDRAATTGTGGLFVFEPLRGTSQVVADPTASLGDVRAAALTPTRGRLLAAVRSAVVPTTDLAWVDLQGTAIAAVSRAATGLPGDIVGLLVLPDSTAFACATQQLLFLPAPGGVHVPLGAPTLGDTFVDLAAFDSGLAMLARRALGGGVIYTFDPSTRTWTSHAIAVDQPTAFAFDPDRKSFVVGTQAGTLHLVESTGFVTSPLATTGGTPVFSVALDVDQGQFVLGMTASVALLRGTMLANRIPLPSVRQVVDLDYRPYESSVLLYGAGCAGTALATPALATSGRPHPGSASFGVLLRNAAPQSPASLLIGLVPRALPLDPLGMFGCVLLLDVLDAIPTATTSTGRAAIALPIPPDPTLAGFALYLQWAVVTPGANRIGVLTSNGARATF